MTTTFTHTPEEKKQIDELFERLKKHIGVTLTDFDEDKLDYYLHQAMSQQTVQRDCFNLSPILHALQSAELSVTEIGLKRDGVIATLLFHANITQIFGQQEIKDDFGDSVAQILSGLLRTREITQKQGVNESENFRNLLLSVAGDMRVILILIADQVNKMRQIRDVPLNEQKKHVSLQAARLYAPLAHKLGLYQLKSELEDLGLKYLEHDAYYMIKDKLNETKRSRDAYIKEFITPIQERLKEAGLNFHMKGRTKSIHSIWQKMKKQQCQFEGIYDLFAIRIIIDAPFEKEQMQCWQAYSIVTDMYTPNPKRLRDWLTVPKSNGYESLHITVLGPQQKWVEIQIRTERMDEIAEHGLAAHWRYKGVKSEGSMDQWLANIRSALEANDTMSPTTINAAPDIFVFTPKGDVMKLIKGATLLDFAYHIHSAVGNKCVGGKINGKNVSIRQELHSGDMIEIVTQSTQKPNSAWLNIVKSPRAKAKIRLALKETQAKDSLYAKEMLERRFKNRKIEMEEGVMSHLIKKMGFKEASDFYHQLAEEKLNANEIIDTYLQLKEEAQTQSPVRPSMSAENYFFNNPNEQKLKENDDVLVIDQNLKGVDYNLAKCCHPIYGDPIFGFVTVNNGIRIHRTNCPNAKDLYTNYSYRIVKAKWSGKGSSKYNITLKVVGQDDIGIINNITNIISKEEKLIIRNINVDSHDGLFSGTIMVMLDDTSHLDSLIKKIQTVRGVKQVTRY